MVVTTAARVFACDGVPSPHLTAPVRAVSPRQPPARCSRLNPCAVAYRCEEGDDARLTYLLADATGQQADLYLAMYHVPPCIQPAGPLSVRVALDVLTGQVRRTVVHVNESDVRVAVCAPPREGLANAELLEYMAKVLGVARSRLHLSRGWSHASKYLLVSNLQPVEIFKRLKAAIETDAMISTAPVAGVVAPEGNTTVGPAATAGAASFAARRHWEVRAPPCAERSRAVSPFPPSPLPPPPFVRLLMHRDWRKHSRNVFCRHTWQEGEELDDLAAAPTRQQQTFIK